MAERAGKPQIAIAGGGIAGLEALLALHDLAGDRVELTLVARDPDFVYRPLIVEEPFSHTPAEQRALAPIAEEHGARFVQRAVAAVRPEEHRLELDDGSTIPYDAAIVCVGARALPAPPGTIEMPLGGQPLAIDEILREAAEHPSRRVAFVLPPGPSWPLPLYELALMSRRRAEELELSGLECAIVTPEPAPLFLFGRIAGDSVAKLLRARDVTVLAGRRVREIEDGVLVMTPEDERLEVGRTIALPALEGPRVPGLPADAHGFIPIDEHARVVGASDLYASGDGANFPIKHGGIGTQQADAAAEHVAARFGAEVEPQAFRPVLRGKLLTGDESLHMRAEPVGGGGEGMTSADALWWPPHKVSGRYLSAWLAGEQPRPDPEPPAHPLDVEVSLPQEWHGEPMAIEPD